MKKTSQASKQDYLQEIGKRLSAQDSLALFGEYIYSWWHAYEMHHVIAYYLEQVVRFLQTGQGIQNLMILTPPQHGKSVEVSNIFPAWALGKIPDLRVLMCSYGADLASDNSREVRNIILTDTYQALFGKCSALGDPIHLASDSRAVTHWDLANPHRGGMVAGGVGGAFTGRARGLVILDDLFKDHRQSESKDYRDDVWDFLRSSIRPRALVKVMIMTHWNPDDCAGRYMRQMVMNAKADQWTILSLPEIALEPEEYPKDVEEQRKKMLEGIYLPLKDPLERKPGEVLCPAMLTKKEALKIKESDNFYFPALYQQMPYLREGGFFKRDWFTIVDSGPGRKALTRVRYWDKAATEGGGARTSGVRMSKGKDGFYYVEHVANAQLSTFKREEMMMRLGKQDYEDCGSFVIWHPQDPASAGLDSARATNKKMSEAELTAHFEPVTGDKEVRAGPASSAAEGVLIRLIRGAWNEPFLDELTSFPAGHFKDQVDAFSSAFSKLAGKTVRESHIL